jgi:DNA-binding MarR family transcriptional regulator
MTRRSTSTDGVLNTGTPRRRLPLLLRAAWYGLNQAFRRRLVHLGITPDQFTVLRNLTEQEGITQRQLTALMSSDPNTVASLLKRMEEAGLVARRTHTRDSRALSLSLTAVGKRKFAAARNVALGLQGELLSVLPALERDRFLAALERVAAECQHLNERRAAARPRRVRSGTSRTP